MITTEPNKMKIALYALWVVAALPLLIYPFMVTTAWEMIWASSYYNGPARDARLAFAVGVMWLAFPVVYFPALFLFRRFMKHASRLRSAIWMTAVPVGYLIAFAVLSVIWTRAEEATIEAQRQPPPVVFQDGLAATMSDDQILRVLQLDPAKMHSKKEKGDDGHSTIYTDEQHEIWITRSSFSGVIVMRMKPEKQLKIWELGNP
jgi:NADH:ubiquinone oxidoreductase subunit 5 (subunit L)/multisubunit Na+/H+ antiporter MnhA subunit